jgi:hypothetical protein
MQDPLLFWAILGVLTAFVVWRPLCHWVITLWVWSRPPKEAWHQRVSQLDNRWSKTPLTQRTRLLKRLYLWQVKRRFIGCTGLHINEEIKWGLALAALMPSQHTATQKSWGKILYVFPAEIILRNQTLEKLSHAASRSFLAHRCELVFWRHHQKQAVRFIAQGLYEQHHLQLNCV